MVSNNGRQQTRKLMEYYDIVLRPKELQEIGHTCANKIKWKTALSSEKKKKNLLKTASAYRFTTCSREPRVDWFVHDVC